MGLAGVAGWSLDRLDIVSADTFGARGTLAVGGQNYEIFRLAALQDSYDVARLPYTLRILLENLLRHEDGDTVTRETVEAVARWVATDEPAQRDHVPAVARPAPGLHRRPRRRRPRRHARGDAGPRRRPGAHRGAHPGRAGHRPLGAGRRVRHPRGLPLQRRARVRAQQGALRAAPLGPAGVRRAQGRPAEHRDRPPGQPRVPRPRGREPRRPGVPGHARRHRLAHDDDQRPRRARLGRRRHRGRGRHARRAAVDARPAGRRLQARRPAARGRDRHRPRPDRDADPAPGRRGREVRRVLRAGPRRARARRPRDDREHVARVRRDVRLLPRRRGDARLPAPHRPAGGAHRPRRGLLPREHALARPRRPPDVLAGRRARPRRRRAEHRRAAPPAGPRAADGGEVVVHRGDADLRRELRERHARQGGRGHVPGQRPDRRARSPARTKSTPSRREPQPVATATHRTHERRRGARRRDVRARPRRRRHRRDHELHEHVEPAGHARRRAAREESRRARAAPPAVGQVVARARLEGRHGVLRARRPDAVPRGARLPHRRLRLHDLHRELRPAARARSRRR